jgi:hypothetical protein
MKNLKSQLIRSATPATIGVLAFTCVAALLPSTLSAATSFTIGFDTDDNTEGFVAYSTASATFSVTTSGGFLVGTSPGGDPRLVNTSSTPIVSKTTGETWSTIVFRVRETDQTATVVTPWANTSVNVVLNSSSVAGGATIISTGSASAVDSGDGFFTVTSDISAFAADDIRYLRFDPIGGSDASGNKFEVDFVQLNAVPEPAAMLLGSLGVLGLLRRRR